MNLPKNYGSESTPSPSPGSPVEDRSNSEGSKDNQSTQRPLYHLKIVSYGGNLGPLPTPGENQRQLDYDLTDISNPPEEIRQNNTGLNPEVQCAVLAEQESNPRLKRILREIKTTMDQVETLHPPDSFASDANMEFLPLELVIGMACGSGKHRSVTFAEQTCRYFQRTKNKRARWGVAVEHRDLNVGHDHEHYYDDEDDDGRGVYEGDYAILSTGRAAQLENDLRGSSGRKRKRYQEEARGNIERKEGGARVVRAAS